jgi:hypothetical protein
MTTTKHIVGGRTIFERSTDARAEQAGYIERWLECDCGAEVDLGRFTNACDECGADYNNSGQRLAPREQWGEETGEHPSECVGPFNDEGDGP